VAFDSKKRKEVLDGLKRQEEQEADPEMRKARVKKRESLAGNPFKLLEYYMKEVEGVANPVFTDNVFEVQLDNPSQYSFGTSATGAIQNLDVNISDRALRARRASDSIDVRSTMGMMLGIESGQQDPMLQYASGEITFAQMTAMMAGVTDFSSERHGKILQESRRLGDQASRAMEVKATAAYDLERFEMSDTGGKRLTALRDKEKEGQLTNDETNELAALKNQETFFTSRAKATDKGAEEATAALNQYLESHRSAYKEMEAAATNGREQIEKNVKEIRTDEGRARALHGDKTRSVLEHNFEKAKEEAGNQWSRYKEYTISPVIHMHVKFVLFMGETCIEGVYE
jgi:hypothetical protein